MIQSSITVSLVEEARGGPFVFWDGFEDGCKKAAALGYDSVELFAPSDQAISGEEIKRCLDETGLKLSAVGTGAGMVIHKLSLCDADASRRSEAKEFIKKIIAMGAPFDAPAIIGSMQGRWTAEIDKPTAMGYLSEALEELGEYAKSLGVILIYEPLNRYEANLVNTVQQGVDLMESLKTDNVKLLADLFHMNIEEANLADAIRVGGKHIGHIHFVDSNRQPTSLGHMNYEPIAQAIKDIDFDGYLSGETFPIPDSDEAARLTIESFKKYFG